MNDVMRGSNEYYRNHPDVAKVMEEENRQQKERADKWQMEHYGTVTEERDSRDAKYKRIMAVPVTIEVPWELDQLVTLENDIYGSDVTGRDLRADMEVFIDGIDYYGESNIKSVLKKYFPKS